VGRISRGPACATLIDVAGARRFRELVCWQLATELKLAVYRKYLAPHDLAELESLAQRTCGAIARLQKYLRGTQRR
jgi:hypothetical protein